VTNLNFDGKFLCFRMNLCIREDTKYLLNPDVNSTYYDPKTRCMRGDPLPDVDPK
jgi:pre-mRNA-processing factor SLU7